MIRGAPSICTTGSAGRLDLVEVGQQAMLASRAHQRHALVIADLGEDVRSGTSVEGGI